MGRALALMLAAAVHAGSAHAATHIVDIAWSPEGRFSLQAEIPAGQFIEACGSLAAGDQISWRFTTTAPVEFNIHYHVGKEAVYPARQAEVSAGRDRLKVTAAQDHCWMWTNKGPAPVSLTVELAR